MASPEEVLGAAAIAGIATGAAHFGTHNLAGDPDTFEEAGVTEAGIASAITAGAVAGGLAAMDE